MKALTISQPYAQLIADGHKWVENRTWETMYRGPLAIHAGKGTQYMTRGEMEMQGMAIGAIVATARLVACLHIIDIIDKGDDPLFRKKLIKGTNLNWSQVRRHSYTEGRFCWILADIQKLDQPVPCQGKQGLWSTQLLVKA